MLYTLKNKEIELTDEEVNEIIKQNQEVEKEEYIKIKNRYTGEVIYSSTKTTYKEAVEQAVNNNANLQNADLRKADLMNAKFHGKGGKTKIRKSQVNDFFKALGVLVED